MSDQSPETVELQSDYFDSLLTPSSLKQTLGRAAKCLENEEYDTLAFRGMSGAILAPTIAMKENKQMIMVRKPRSQTHSIYSVEGNKKAHRYIIVDDFIESGQTVCEIVKAIKVFARKAKCLGILIACDGQHSEFLPLAKFKRMVPETWHKYFGRKRK